MTYSCYYSYFCCPGNNSSRSKLFLGINISSNARKCFYEPYEKTGDINYPSKNMMDPSWIFQLRFYLGLRTPVSRHDILWKLTGPFLAMGTDRDNVLYTSDRTRTPVSRCRVIISVKETSYWKEGFSTVVKEIGSWQVHRPLELSKSNFLLLHGEIILPRKLPEDWVRFEPFEELIIIVMNNVRVWRGFWTFRTN